MGGGGKVAALQYIGDKLLGSGVGHPAQRLGLLAETEHVGQVRQHLDDGAHQRVALGVAQLTQTDGLANLSQGFFDGQGLVVVDRHRAEAANTILRSLPPLGVLAHQGVGLELQHRLDVLALAYSAAQTVVEQLMENRLQNLQPVGQEVREQ